ncbi:MAG: hypothetical protein ABIT68_01780 [Sphingomicrobium sp.]
MKMLVMLAAAIVSLTLVVPTVAQAGTVSGHCSGQSGQFMALA